MTPTIRCFMILVWLVTLTNYGQANLFDFADSNNYTMLCQSMGCVCSTDLTTEVDCSKKELTTLPNGISFPEKLTYATFSGNNLDTITNNVFLLGPDVISVDLSKNAIRFISGEAFTQLPKLESLDLSHNELWSLNINTFSGMKLLRVMDLSYNKINSFFPDVFKPTENLRSISLRYNPMLFVEDNSFKFLPELDELNLESVGLASIPGNVFKNNTNLKMLYLGGNALKSVPSGALSSAVRLQQLDLSQNPIESLGKNAFKGLNKMEVLILNHLRRLRKIESGAFRELPSLRELYLSDNLELATISETAFGTTRELFTDELYEKRSLQKVIMRHNAIKNLPPNLLRWDELYELDLSENPWNCDCRMAWVASQPLTDRTKKTIVCASPPHCANKMVLSMGHSDFVCRYLSPEAIIGLALLVGFAFILALGGAAFLLYRKRLCNCILHRATAHRYTRVVTTKDKVDLEWDHGAEPLTSSRSRTSSDA